jgi:hypothetical protein
MKIERNYLSHTYTLIIYIVNNNNNNNNNNNSVYRYVIFDIVSLAAVLNLEKII